MKIIKFLLLSILIINPIYNSMGSLKKVLYTLDEEDAKEATKNIKKFLPQYSKEKLRNFLNGIKDMSNEYRHQSLNQLALQISQKSNYIIPSPGNIDIGDMIIRIENIMAELFTEGLISEEEVYNFHNTLELHNQF